MRKLLLFFVMLYITCIHMVLANADDSYMTIKTNDAVSNMVIAHNKEEDIIFGCTGANIEFLKLAHKNNVADKYSENMITKFVINKFNDVSRPYLSSDMLSVSNDGSKFAFGNWWGMMKIIDATTLQCLKTFDEQSLSITAIALSPDGNTFVYGTEYGNSCYIVDLKSGDRFELDVNLGKSPISSAAYSPCGSRIAVTTNDEIAIYNISEQKLQELKKIELENRVCQNEKQKRPIKLIAAKKISSKRVSNAVFSSDSKLIAVVCNDCDEIIILSEKNSEYTTEATLSIKPDLKANQTWSIIDSCNAAVWSVAFSPNNKFLVGTQGAVQNSAIKVWDIASKKLIKTFTGHTNTIYRAYFLDDHTIVSGSMDKTIKFWEYL